MVAQPDYSIIVPAYNEEQELPATLQALRQAMAEVPLTGELIVTDNNSSDDTAAVALQGGADRVVFEPHNQISRARNAGAAAAKGRFLIFVDADTRINGLLLQEAVQRLETGAVCGGGAAMEFEDTDSWVGKVGMNLWGRVSRWLKLAAGSFIYCRRDAFEASGGFDETVYAGEEIGLSRRLKQWGKPRGMRFHIITTEKVRTSARKLQWFSTLQIVRLVAMMAIMPLAVRSRKLCRFWYTRPGQTDPP